MTGGVALLDFDKDGWLDIYFVNAPIVDTFTDPEILSHLYRNNRDGTFKDVTREANIGKPGWGMGACAGDYDGDGWLDPYVTCLGNNKLYANNGDGTFEEVAQRVGLDERRWSTGCTFGDYDNDGDLDLFVSNYLDFSLEDLPYQPVAKVGRSHTADIKWRYVYGKETVSGTATADVGGDGETASKSGTSLLRAVEPGAGESRV